MDPPEQLAVRAWVRLVEIHRTAHTAVRDALELDLTMPRFHLLEQLGRADGQTMAALGRAMRVKASTLTGLVDRAARDGLVERRSHPEDRRAWRVHLTTKGQRAFREAERRHATRIGQFFAALSPAELRTLVHLLDRIRDPRARAETPSRVPGTGERGPLRADLAKPRRSRPKRETG